MAWMENSLTDRFLQLGFNAFVKKCPSDSEIQLTKPKTLTACKKSSR
jgi:hypothetical protein